MTPHNTRGWDFVPGRTSSVCRPGLLLSAASSRRAGQPLRPGQGARYRCCAGQRTPPRGRSAQGLSLGPISLGAGLILTKAEAEQREQDDRYAFDLSKRPDFLANGIRLPEGEVDP